MNLKPLRPFKVVTSTLSCKSPPSSSGGPPRLPPGRESPQSGNVKKIRKPKPWKHPQPLTKSQLMQLRDEFWDTAPHYGGRKEIWDALRAAAEADLGLVQAIVDSAGVIVQNAYLGSFVGVTFYSMVSFLSAIA